MRVHSPLIRGIATSHGRQIDEITICDKTRTAAGSRVILTTRYLDISATDYTIRPILMLTVGKMSNVIIMMLLSSYITCKICSILFFRCIANCNRTFDPIMIWFFQLHDEVHVIWKKYILQKVTTSSQAPLLNSCRRTRTHPLRRLRWQRSPWTSFSTLSLKRHLMSLIRSDRVCCVSNSNLDAR